MWTHYSKTGEKSKDQEIVFKEAQGENPNKKSHYLQRSNNSERISQLKQWKTEDEARTSSVCRKLGFFWECKVSLTSKK